MAALSTRRNAIERRARPGGWFVYVIRTADGALYTGITTDVERRCAAHAAHRGAKSLRGRGPLVVVYRVHVGDRALAARVEHALKRVRKSAKEAIVRAAPSRARLLRRLGVEPRARAATETRV